MIIVWLAALGASIVTGLLVSLAYATAGGKPPLPDSVLRWGVRLWLCNFVFDLALFYFTMPALTGPYWGSQWLLWPLLLSGLLALFGGSLTRMWLAADAFSGQVNSGTLFGPAGLVFGGLRREKAVSDKRPRGDAPYTSGRAGALALALVVLVAIVGNGLIAVATTWFDPNARALAAIPQITVEPASAQLPPTDVNHMVLVSHGNAAYLGQTALAANGQNLGSLYHTDLADYTLQSVRGHLYWIAPLVYNNVWANLGHWESPGYIAVDAEDPNAGATLHTGYHLHYLPAALFNQDLMRHVYLSGYTDGNLVDPTLEVDDNWKPYFTISLMQPSRGFSGEVVRRVLVVDPQSGAIASYAPQDVPAWVDRIIPADTVTHYLTWWGEYSRAPWFNPSGSNQQVPAVDANDQPQLVYDTVDHPVWLVPMTSSASTDNSSTGIVLFDTRDNRGRFYPLTGLGVTKTVKSLFQTSPANIRNYTPANVQLYQIYGEPTWITTFVQPNDYGESFQAIGLVDARHLNGANVVIAPTKSQALAAYLQWLADHNIQTAATPSGKPVTLQSTVTRISAATENGTTVYYLLLQGQTRIFKAGLALSPTLPLVQPGDVVQVTFLDTGQNVVTLTSFSDASIPLAAPTPSPTATASP
jgi:hypothetical protein